MKKSRGNPYAHIVLRGANDFTNYDTLSVSATLEKLEKAHLASPILIDCSHGNCQKQPHRQKDVFLDVIQQLEQGSENICGLMLESHLQSGYQSLSDPTSLTYAVSITDPCINWETTETLMRYAHQSLSSSYSLSKI
jgi:3-deoxy-7-phosphoheptulonate synthase